MSNTRIWVIVCFYSALLNPCTFSPLVSAEVEQLTLCDRSSTEKSARSLVFVSTLDGKISALDASDHGKKKWTLDFNQGPMLSSSIHRRELNNNGQWIRLIPSLNGGLYKFDGENVEVVPVTAQQLLHSSFRYSDDLLFSGGKETRSYGVSSATGKILYECGISGCLNNTNGDGYIEREVLIVQRLQQTIRAVEPRTGIERWNFSVGQHDVIIVPGTNAYCEDKVTTLDIDIKVLVPEGLIWAINKNKPTVKLWQHKFDSPIVTIWREDTAQDASGQKTLKEVNLFDNSQWTWGSDLPVSPGIYIGMHDRQLYIQENANLHKSLEERSLKYQHRRYPWQPYPAVETAIVNVEPQLKRSKNKNSAVPELAEAQSTTALSVLYNSEYINGNGFYLYSKDQLQLDNNSCNDSNFIIIDEEESFIINTTHDDDDTPVQVIIVSLWYWWKEVVIISITTAILLNFMLTQRLLNATTVAKDAVLPPLIVERHVETKKNDYESKNNGESVATFKSRYLTDFEPVDCLGKGGYGVVFEAKNKIDDCNYAIKRIALPNSQDSRERVMREVKALAKLDHHNIVRYFNAWLECPPVGWQEEHDQQWINKQRFPPSEFLSELTQTETKAKNSVCITVYQTDQSSVDSACEAYALNHSSGEDSFIVFDRSNRKERAENVINISDCSTQSSDISVSNNPKDEKSSITNTMVSSQSIVFKQDASKHAKESEKDKRRKSFSLNLHKSTIANKSAKMFLYIQMQLCQRLSLREWLKEQSAPRDSRHVINIFHQIVNAVEYVHLQGLIHRDLKPSNIFFAYDDKIKIGDFGLVTAMTEGYDEAHTPASDTENITLKNSLHTACVGTHLYMSPEQMNGQNYNYKVDIYSLGIILFELLIPFVTEMERVAALINLRKSTFPMNFDSDYPAEYDLLKMMLAENPDRRPTTLGIKAKPPLQNYETANGLITDKSSKWHFELP
ncbi:hypothetical protein KM043_017306 [Ampulex compressa]|nr:hypothetical protein KM043_017306 [Ampulex compressa]